MRIAVIGRGRVGGGLARRWVAAGHDVTSFGRDGGDAAGSEAVLVAIPGDAIADGLAAAHGMGLMVQDLTNPMLAQIPHVLLAAHVGTIMGVETNAMQFYPEASRAEADLFSHVDRDRGDTLLTVAWLTAAPQDW